ncbi:MAG: O-methyltransferase [Bacteroidales bacterium]
MSEDWFNPLSELEQYCIVHSVAEGDLLNEIARFTWTTKNYPRMISGHLQGRLLSFLSRLRRPQCILEIGTFTGYSALCLAEGLQQEGELHTFEIDPELEEPVRRFFSRSALGGKLFFHLGDALQIIPSLNIRPQLVYIDGDKEQYPAYLEACMPIMEPGSLLIADNTLWGGKVLRPQGKKDKETESIRLFNHLVKNHPRLEPLLLPFGDGLTLAWVR